MMHVETRKKVNFFLQYKFPIEQLLSPKQIYLDYKNVFYFLKVLTNSETFSQHARIFFLKFRHTYKNKENLKS